MNRRGFIAALIAAAGTPAVARELLPLPAALKPKTDRRNFVERLLDGELPTGRAVAVLVDPDRFNIKHQAQSLLLKDVADAKAAVAVAPFRMVRSGSGFNAEKPVVSFGQVSAAGPLELVLFIEMGNQWAGLFRMPGVFVPNGGDISVSWSGPVVKLS